MQMETGMEINALDWYLCSKYFGQYVENDLDCNDNDSKINPGSPEVCDGIDNNCDRKIDNNLRQFRFYQDKDGDGFGNINIFLMSA